jgi:hypothetical protein
MFQRTAPGNKKQAGKLGGAFLVFQPITGQHQRQVRHPAANHRSALQIIQRVELFESVKFRPVTSYLNLGVKPRGKLDLVIFHEFESKIQTKLVLLNSFR